MDSENLKLRARDLVDYYQGLAHILRLKGVIRDLLKEIDRLERNVRIWEKLAWAERRRHTAPKEPSDG